jgi:hypothetical protein
MSYTYNTLALSPYPLNTQQSSHQGLQSPIQLSYANCHAKEGKMCFGLTLFVRVAFSDINIFIMN